MNCDAFERRIGELAGLGQLSETDSELEQHSSECLACRGFRDVWASLDVELKRRADSVRLPANFKARVLTKLPMRPRLTAGEIAAKHAQSEQEYLAAKGALGWRRQFPRPEILLLAMVVISGVVVAERLVVPSVRALAPAAEEIISRGVSTGTILITSLGLGLASLLFGLHMATRATLRQIRF